MKGGQVPSNFKKLVRARMAETGEGWQPAARYIVGLGGRTLIWTRHMQLVIEDAGAVVSEDGKYRYRLWRNFGKFRPLFSHKRYPPPNQEKRVLWIMLNPSTADGKEDDPTVRRCMGFAYRWGYGGIEVVNLYAFRATQPDVLKECGQSVDIVGPQNNQYICQALEDESIGKVVVAWGRALRAFAIGRIHEVVEIIQHQEKQPECLGFTRGGEPRHPLRVPYKEPLRAFGGSRLPEGE
jgi:hypothetical protein